MVHLFELVSTRSIQIDDETSAKIIFDLDQVANHLHCATFDNLLHKLRAPGLVSEIGLSRSLQGLCCCFLFSLRPELNGEDVVLHGVEELCKAGHVHGDLFLEVVRTVHVGYDVTRDNHISTV